MKQHFLAPLLAGVAMFASVSSLGCAGDASNDDDVIASADAVRVKSDRAIQNEIRAAARGTVYVSESDDEFTLVRASLPADTTEISEALVREKLAGYIDQDDKADHPLATLFGEEADWEEWKAGYDPVDCGREEGEFPGPAECAGIRKMNAALDANLHDIKVFYFGSRGHAGSVEGIGISLVIVGLTPRNNLVGVRTVGVWT